MYIFLDERDKELIDGQIDELTNNVSELKGDIRHNPKILTYTSGNIDLTIPFSKDEFCPILHLVMSEGTYTSNLTAFALQQRALSTDPWSDIFRVYATDGGYSAVERYFVVPSTATQLRIVSHNNSVNSVTLTLFRRQPKTDTNYITYAESSFTNQATTENETQTENIRVNLKKGITYKIGIYCERDTFVETPNTSDAVKFYDEYNGNNELVAINRIADGKIDLMPYRWTYFDYTPSYDISLCVFYIAGLKTQGAKGKLTLSFEQRMDYPVGYVDSVCSDGIRFLHETSPKLANISVGRGTALQSLKKLNEELFVTFKSDDANGIGYANIIKNIPMWNNVSGYSAYISHAHAELMHVINASHLKNGNLLVAAKASDNSRNAYEYNYSTDNIVNTFNVPAVDPNNGEHLSQFIVPVGGDTQTLYVGYCENIAYPTKAVMTVYEYDNGTMKAVGNFDYLPLYTQDACVYGNNLFVMGHAGYGCIDSYITVVNMDTWDVVGVYTITNAGEAEGIDVVNDGDSIKAYTAGNNGVPFVRTFIL